MCFDHFFHLKLLSDVLPRTYIKTRQAGSRCNCQSHDNPQNMNYD